MRVVLFLLSYLFLALAKEPDCGAATECADPVKNLQQLILCRITDIMSIRGVDKVLKEIATEFCKGMDAEQIAAHIQKTVSKGVDLLTVEKVLEVMPKFEKCLKQNNYSQNETTMALGKVLEDQFGSVLTQLQEASTEYKGKCKSPDLYVSLSKIGCPLLTHETVQKFLTAAKTEIGPSFDCWKKYLDGKILKLSYYDV